MNWNIFLVHDTIANRNDYIKWLLNTRLEQSKRFLLSYFLIGKVAAKI